MTVGTGRALDEAVEPVRARPSRTRAPRGFLVGGGIVGLAAMLPVLYLIVRASGSEDLVGTLTERRTIELLGRTIALVAAVTASTVAIGVPVAWATTRLALPGRRTLAVATALPLVIPTYVGAFTVIAALGPRGMLADLLGVRLPEIYGFFGSWLTLTLLTYPYVVLTVRAALRTLDPSLEEAARSLGHDAKAIARRVILPQLRPSIAAGAVLVALYTLHDFGAVSLLRTDTFTRGIYLSYSSSFDRSRAAVLSLVVVAITLVVVAIEARARGRAAYYRAHGTARRSRAPVRTSRTWIAFGGCVLLVAAAVGMPVGVITYWSLRSARALDLGGTGLAAVHSLQVAGVAAIVAVVASWPVAFLSVRHPSRTARSIERATFVGYALPGLVVALALVYVGIRVVPALYQTLPMLVFAVVILFLPQATGALRASLLQIPPSVEEAARALGARRARVLGRVLLPMMRAGFASGFALVFLTAMKELPATLLLAPTGYATLATRVWSATSAAFFDRAAVPALVLVALACVPLAVLMSKDQDERGLG